MKTVCRPGGTILIENKRSTRTKTCPSDTSSTTHYMCWTWIFHRILWTVDVSWWYHHPCVATFWFQINAPQRTVCCFLCASYPWQWDCVRSIAGAQRIGLRVPRDIFFLILWAIATVAEVYFLMSYKYRNVYKYRIKVVSFSVWNATCCNDALKFMFCLLLYLNIVGFVFVSPVDMRHDTIVICV